MAVIRSAVSKYGRPAVFNFDNGHSYRNQQMELLAARIGSVVHYCRPYTPIQKAKIERWFRTLRDCWMSSLDMRELLYSSVVNSDAHNKTMNRDTTSGFAMHRINIARKHFTSQRKKGEKALIL